MRAFEARLDTVARELSFLEPGPVFVGGATVGLFVDALGRSQLRPTLDVACIVPGIASRAAWWKLEEDLRARKWHPDPDGPLCRYTSPSGETVDVMPMDPSILGFADRWYAELVPRAETIVLPSGRAIRVPTPAHLFVCKLEAWRDRGRADPMMSKDLEDVMALLDGCRDLERSVTTSRPHVREAVREGVGGIVADPRVLEVAIGQLPRGGDAEAQRRRVLGLMARLVGDTGHGPEGGA